MMPNWNIFTERVGNEAIFYTVQWIGGHPVMSSEVKSVQTTSDGEVARFDIPVIGVMPLL